MKRVSASQSPSLVKVTLKKNNVHNKPYKIRKLACSQSDRCEHSDWSEFFFVFSQAPPKHQSIQNNLFLLRTSKCFNIHSFDFTGQKVVYLIKSKTFPRSQKIAQSYASIISVNLMPCNILLAPHLLCNENSADWLILNALFRDV